MMKTLVAAVLIAVLGACASLGGAPVPAKFDGGTLVDSAGMTLYTFDRDTAGSGKSACNGPCIALWPALKAADTDRPAGDWSIVTRDDGSKQWAYKSKPVYLWVKDQKPGDKSGDGVNKVWHLIAQ